MECPSSLGESRSGTSTDREKSIQELQNKQQVVDEVVKQLRV